MAQVFACALNLYVGVTILELPKIIKRRPSKKDELNAENGQNFSPEQTAAIIQQKQVA